MCSAVPHAPRRTPSLAHGSDWPGSIMRRRPNVGLGIFGGLFIGACFSVIALVLSVVSGGSVFEECGTPPYTQRRPPRRFRDQWPAETAGVRS